MADPAFTFTDQIRPVCEIGMSDVREAEPDEWVDVSCHVHEVEIFRGRERFSDHFMRATASITFDNRSGWGDLVGAPLIVAGQTLRPARPIRVGVSGVFDDDTVESTRWLYRGWIDQATPAYDPVLHDVVTVNCIDAFGEAGQSVAPTGPEQGVNETVSARVNRVLDAVGWFPTKRKVATVSTTVQGTPLGSRAVDLMTAAADSAGGVVFGDLDGDVVLKGIDWMLYDPDDPPDGEIGNMDPGEPELEDVPVYVDPTEGTVYDPDPPPMERPPIVQFCVQGGEPNGTIVEQGDSWRIFVAGGQLRYESSGRVWDMGAYTGEGCTTIYPPGDDPDSDPPERVDECPEGLFWDPDLEECVEEPTCPGETTDPSVARTALEEDDPHPDTSPDGAGWVGFDVGMWIYTDDSRYDAEGWRNAAGEAMLVWSPTFEECVPVCSEGQVFDLGTDTCVPECPEGQWWDVDAGACVDEPECPEGQEWVWNTDSPGGACEDMTPVPPPDVPAPGPGPGDPPPEEGDPIGSLFTVELLGWDDGGLDDDPAAHIDPITITPGTDCLIVILINAINTDANSGLLVAAVNGGGLNWSHRRNADQAGEGAPSFIVLAEVGRDDPGTFNVQVDWAAGMTTQAHIATVWRVKNAVNDYVDKFDAGLVLYAVVDSNPPDEAQPGDGPQTVTMVADDPPVGFPALPRAVDITIAQSLAEESTGPFGATFDDSNGPWIIPDNVPAPTLELLIGTPAEWSDDFERADGPVGDEWVLGLITGSDEEPELPTISSGAATGPSYSGSPKSVATMSRAASGPADHQYIEVTFENWLNTSNPLANMFIDIYNFGGGGEEAHEARRLATFNHWMYVTGTVSTVVIGAYTYLDDGSTSEGRSSGPTPPYSGSSGVQTFRLDSYADGRQVVTWNGVVWLDYVEEETPFATLGYQQGVYMAWREQAGRTSPRILSVSGGGSGGAKTSWVAGWRQGSTDADVVFDDVNLGDDDIQSAQVALVLESAEVELFPIAPYGPITIGGVTDPLVTSTVDYVGLFDPVTGDPILRFP